MFGEKLESKTFRTLLIISKDTSSNRSLDARSIFPVAFSCNQNLSPTLLLQIYCQQKTGRITEAAER
jgi:hypothetical protein